MIRNAYNVFWSEDLKEIDLLEDLSIDGRITDFKVIGCGQDLSGSRQG
jgi:hypothetical protein